MAQQIKKKFLGDDQVDGDKISLLQGQSIKIQDGSGVESDLIKLGPSGEVLVGSSGYEVANKASLTQEIADRVAGDAFTLSSANTYTDGEISTLETSVNAAISAEEAARITGDADTLAAAQAAAIAYTDGETDALSQALDANINAEIANRISADANLQSQIDAISGGGSGSISALQTELDATQAGAGLDASGNYVVNPSAIYISNATSLHSATQTLDSVAYGLDQGLSQEQTDRIAAVQDLQDQINNVLSNVDPAAIDSLTEVVSAFQAADASLNGAITALSTGLSADILAEENARIAADSALQGEIDAEEIARAAADTTLQNNINAEASARQAADDALDVRVDALEAVVWVKEKFSIVNGQTSVTLSFTPKANSMSAFVDRLAIHEGAADDYTISGTTMTFLNDLVSPGQSSLGAGDTVYVKYQK